MFELTKKKKITIESEKMKTKIQNILKFIYI